MKINLLLVLVGLFSTTSAVWPHGPAHSQRAAVDETLEFQETAIPVTRPDAVERWWGANVNTGWESRHVHYGVDESGPTGAYVNEVGLRLGDLSFNAWNGIGTGNRFLEWDFTVAYNLELGPVFIVPGYNLRYVPSYAESDSAHDEEEHADGEEEEQAHESHIHNATGNELFVAVGTTIVPYITPSANLVWDLNNSPGGFMELRLDGDVPLPVCRDVFSVQPYALLGLNLGYNTTAYYGWNNLQFGAQITAALTEYISVFAGVNCSIALEAMLQIGQDDVVWANTGVSFAY